MKSSPQRWMHSKGDPTPRRSHYVGPPRNRAERREGAKTERPMGDLTASEWVGWLVAILAVATFVAVCGGN